MKATLPSRLFTLSRRFMRVLALAAAISVPFALASVSAQHYPSRVVTLVVPFPAGSGTDAVARVVQPLLAAELKATVIIENRPGVNGSIGAAYVSRATADGYTLLFTTATSHSITPYVSKHVSYDPIRDFTPVGQVGIFPVMLVTSNALPVRTVPDLIQHVKSHPGLLQYAFGNGTGQVAGAALRTYAGLDIVAVPYRGTPAAMTDLIAGRINYMFVDATTGLPHVRANSVRGLAVTTLEPSALIPDLPTMAAAGLPMFNLSAWCGVFGPSRLPNPIVEKLDAALKSVMASPDLTARLGEMGFEVSWQSADDFALFAKADNDRWRMIIRDAHVVQAQ